MSVIDPNDSDVREKVSIALSSCSCSCLDDLNDAHRVEDAIMAALASPTLEHAKKSADAVAAAPSCFHCGAYPAEHHDDRDRPICDDPECGALARDAVERLARQLAESAGLDPDGLACACGACDHCSIARSAREQAALAAPASKAKRDAAASPSWPRLLHPDEHHMARWGDQRLTVEGWERLVEQTQALVIEAGLAEEGDDSRSEALEWIDQGFAPDDTRAWAIGAKCQRAEAAANLREAGVTAEQAAQRALEGNRDARWLRTVAEAVSLGEWTVEQAVEAVR